MAPAKQVSRCAPPIPSRFAPLSYQFFNQSLTSSLNRRLLRKPTLCALRRRRRARLLKPDVSRRWRRHVTRKRRRSRGEACGGRQTRGVYGAPGRWEEKSLWFQHMGLAMVNYDASVSGACQLLVAVFISVTGMTTPSIGVIAST